MSKIHSKYAPNRSIQFLKMQKFSVRALCALAYNVLNYCRNFCPPPRKKKIVRTALGYREILHMQKQQRFNERCYKVIFYKYQYTFVIPAYKPSDSNDILLTQQSKHTRYEIKVFSNFFVPSATWFLSFSFFFYQFGVQCSLALAKTFFLHSRVPEIRQTPGATYLGEGGGGAAFTFNKNICVIK